MIPTEALEAAEQAVVDAMYKYGPDGHIDGYQEIARAALEAAEASRRVLQPINLTQGASRMVNVPAAAVQAAHAAICEQNLDDCLDPDWRGKCVKAVEAAAPYMLEEAEQEITNLKRIIALLVLDAGGRATISCRDMAALSDETIIETTEDVTAGGWAIRVDPPDELEKRRKYTALDAISELGSDEPNERFTKRSKT